MKTAGFVSLVEMNSLEKVGTNDEVRIGVGVEWSDDWLASGESLDSMPAEERKLSEGMLLKPDEVVLPSAIDGQDDHHLDRPL